MFTPLSFWLFRYTVSVDVCGFVGEPNHIGLAIYNPRFHFDQATKPEIFDTILQLLISQTNKTKQI